MKKAVFLLTIIMLVSLGALTGCSLFGGNDTNTNTQESNEEVPKKEVETEEKEKDTKDKKVEELKNNEESKKESNSEYKEVNSNSNNGSDAKEGGSKTSESSSNSKSGGQENQVDWGSAWTRDINTDWAVIEITEQKEDTIKFNINSIHTDNAEAARGGYINVGDVKGTAKVSGNVATQTTDEMDNGCMVKMINHQSYIQVEPITDCSGGGGLGVYFEGKYKKGDIPATDWWKKESSGNGETGEPKEEPNQTTEKEQSTDDAEDATLEGTQTSLTREQAIQCVKEYLNLSLENMRYVDEGDTATGKYLIRVYQYQEATADSTEHEAPYGYFIVDPRTGEVTDVNND
ncbi:hypothetical protein [Priestia aryabhattai]|uniref:hypothetical protein n=1 Tax=Priestia aryabhattai TaxID=412384 RepID=UPI002380ACB6|nr:hypothetical protein [Priestia aryabhattai]WDW06616.1 hypothetical protein PWC21_13865 [Priestia aryabhattai]